MYNALQIKCIFKDCFVKNINTSTLLEQEKDKISRLCYHYVKNQ